MNRLICGRSNNVKLKMSAQPTEVSSLTEKTVTTSANSSMVIAYWSFVVLTIIFFISAVLTWNQYSKLDGTENQRRWAIGLSISTAIAFVVTLFVKPCNTFSTTVQNLATLDTELDARSGINNNRYRRI